RAYESALAAWQPAAARGDVNAQLGLAVIYHDGLGVDQDLSTAALWFRRAADQGLAEAQFNLGVLLYSGRGVAPDPVEAARWYILAGDQGHGEANYYLGTMYVAGLGVGPDNLAAYRRFELAVDQSRASGETALNRLAVQGREAVTRRLSRDEIAVLEGRAGAGAPAEVAVEAPDDAPDDAADEVVAAVEEPARQATNARGRLAESGGLSVSELEDAAGEAREAQASVDTLETRLAELEGAAEESRVAPAEASVVAAAQQLSEIDDHLAAERATQTATKQALVRAETGTETAQRRLSSQRRALAGAQTQMDAIAEELAEIEARRQVTLRRQAGSQEQFDAVNKAVEEKAAALDEQRQQGALAKKGLEESDARLAALDENRAKIVTSQAAAERRLRAAVESNEETTGALAAARVALREANEAAAAARNRLAAATLAFNQANLPEATPDPVIATAPQGQPGQPSTPAEVPEERVARVQRSLASLGYDPGRADGVAGERTLDALRQFQADNGLPVTGKVTEEMAFSLAILASAQAVPVQRQLALAGTGTGFVIAGDGHVLTNDHVVKGCVEVRVKYGGEVYVAPHLASDESNDLALLNTAIQTEDFLAFRAGRAIRPGDDVVVLGFPLQGQLSDQVKVTKGTISALAGPQNNRTLLQTTAPVQAGSSGGPLLDLSGNIVGVVMGKISSVEVENVSFGIKSAIARIFLDAEGVNYRSSPSEGGESAADVAARARQFIVLVECWNE
ncbi:MAG: trypsin-like peptidase domain-containing protein, partial [Alphaproteobacteria bacterium]